MALLRLALQPWRRFAVSTQIWGVDTETGNWMQLDDLDQRQWQAAALSWVTPWFLLVRLHQSDQPHQHRWWWCWQGWVSEADYRRLSRWLLRRREYSGLGIRK
ncbi:hypothetical protein AKK84_01670 [Idiomarina sp. FeN1w]|nr:hypothetical protein [Idiomarina sp. FeN1]